MSSETVRKRLSLQSYVDGILIHDRVVLSKAITLVESNLPADVELAESLIHELLPHTGRSQRVGITGVPGVGKSTFIEAFGLYLIGLSKSVAVLTIDPSSQRSKGSILGDKTRMEKLSNHEKAFVRPSASGTSLGGVNARTREAMLLCEAFGFDIIIIETVGVGQNETTLRGIVDFFLLLMLAGAGDELQGIKRGIMEMADAIAINKADGDNVRRSELAKREYEGALHLFPSSESGWIPKVVTCSSVEGTGLETIYELVCEHEWQTKSTGHFERFRLQQNLNWMWETVMIQLQSDFHNNSRVKEAIPSLQKKVENGELPPMTAARELMALFSKGK